MYEWPIGRSFWPKFEQAVYLRTATAAIEVSGHSTFYSQRRKASAVNSLGDPAKARWQKFTQDWPQYDFEFDLGQPQSGYSSACSFNSPGFAKLRGTSEPPCCGHRAPTAWCQRSKNG